MAPNYYFHGNLHHHALKNKITSVSLKNIFDEAVKVTNFMKSHVFFNILFHEPGSTGTYKSTFCFLAKWSGWFKGKQFLAPFFVEHYFYLKEFLANCSSSDLDI